MRGIARHSPSARKIANVEHRIARLEKFELWASCIPLNVESLVPPELWKQYYAIQGDILKKMRDAQELAIEIAREIKSRIDSEHA